MVPCNGGRSATLNRLCAVGFGVMLGMASGTAPAKAEGQVRPVYQARCELPRAAWNEEILHVREAAERECKGNLVLRAGDATAAISTTAQDEFWKLRAQHEALVRASH